MQCRPCRPSRLLGKAVQVRSRTRLVSTCVPAGQGRQSAAEDLANRADGAIIRGRRDRGTNATVLPEHLTPGHSPIASSLTYLTRIRTRAISHLAAAAVAALLTALHSPRHPHITTAPWQPTMPSPTLVLVSTSASPKPSPSGAAHQWSTTTSSSTLSVGQWIRR